MKTAIVSLALAITITLGCRSVYHITITAGPVTSRTTAEQGKEVGVDALRGATAAVMPGAEAAGGNVTTEVTGDGE